MPERRLLVAVYDYPPSTSVGGIRWLTMKKYLERLGHEVIVLTTDAYGRLPTDDAEHVIRVTDLVASPRLRSILRRPPLASSGQNDSVEAPVPALLTSVFVPDIYAVSWVPFAVRAMRRLVHEREVDALITTSPQESTHLIGLARPGRLPWIADFRDGWIFEPVRAPLPTRPQRGLDRKLEASVVHRSDAVVAFSDVLAEDFERRLGRRTQVISNGFDPELAALATTSEAQLDPVTPPRVRLVYTGTLTLVEGAPTDRSPMPLLEGLADLAATDGELAQRIELLIIGKRSQRDQAILTRFDHLGSVRHLGYVARTKSLAIQRSADVLVVVSGTTQSSVPLKLFEYLGAGRPILHLGRQGAAAQVLAETNSGVTIAPDDHAAVVEQLRRIATGDFGRDFAPRGLDKYAYPRPAEQMADLIEEVIAARDATPHGRAVGPASTPRPGE